MFKSHSLGSGMTGESMLQSPGNTLFCKFPLSCIVLIEAIFNLIGMANVEFGQLYTVNDIDEKHYKKRDAKHPFKN